jgi:hypothetical protein
MAQAAGSQAHERVRGMEAVGKFESATGDVLSGAATQGAYDQGNFVAIDEVLAQAAGGASSQSEGKRSTNCIRC